MFLWLSYLVVNQQKLLITLSIVFIHYKSILVTKSILKPSRINTDCFLGQADRKKSQPVGKKCCKSLMPLANSW